MEFEDVLKDLSKHARRSWHVLRLDIDHYLVDAGVTWYVCDRHTMIKLMKAERGAWHIEQ